MTEGNAERPKRFGELTKFLPVLFVTLIIATLYMIFVFYHCIPLLQLDKPEEDRTDADVQRGRIELVVFHIVTVLLMISYVRSIIVSPGEIPETKEWLYPSHDKAAEAGDDNSTIERSLQETKRSGERRHCKWCGKYKPDRCHHCRVCKTCILKMDHHCPWIYNCVGFRNHKFFFLLLLYSVISCHFISWTMFESVKKSVDTETPFSKMFMLLFGETLAAFLGVLVTAFFGFHIWLMFKAMTTIEFCEKSLKKTGYNSSQYDRGCVGNIQEVLGTNLWFWFLPIAANHGDGLSFISEKTRLNVDLEAGRGQRKEGRGKKDERRRSQSSRAGSKARGRKAGDRSSEESGGDRGERGSRGGSNAGSRTASASEAEDPERTRSSSSSSSAAPASSNVGAYEKKPEPIQEASKEEEAQV